MKKLPVVSSDEVINALERGGFTYAPKRGRGSHTALIKIDEKGCTLLVIVPKRSELPKGTLTSLQVLSSQPSHILQSHLDVLPLRY
jgi:predicted RNA binding protein YcfA (HicA-like mRNA interferase family)